MVNIIVVFYRKNIVGVIVLLILISWYARGKKERGERGGPDLSWTSWPGPGMSLLIGFGLRTPDIICSAVLLLHDDESEERVET